MIVNELFYLFFNNIRMYHEFEDSIDKSVLRVTVWHHKALPNSDLMETNK